MARTHRPVLVPERHVHEIERLLYELEEQEKDIRELEAEAYQNVSPQS